MSVIRWRGDAGAVQQVNTVTPGSVGIGNVFTLVINGKALAFTATAATVANVTAGLVALVNAATATPEWAEVTAADNTTNLTLTANTAGVPFTQSSSATGGSATLVTVTTTAGTGPNDIGNGLNYSSGALPVGGDDLYFENSASPGLYNLQALAAITLNSVNFAASFTGPIGLPYNNPSGYVEYRPLYLQLAPSGTFQVNIGYGPGNGSGRIKLDTQTYETILNVYNAATSVEQGIEAVLWKGSNASNVVNLLKGTFGAAVFAGETATIATLRCGYTQNQSSDVQARTGTGCTLATVNKTGGTLTLNSAATTVTQLAGVLTILGSGAVTTLTVNGGTANYRSTGTLGTATVFGGATLDFSGDQQAKALTNPITLYEGATLNDPDGVLPLNWQFTIPDGTLGAIVINAGFGQTYRRTA